MSSGITTTPGVIPWGCYHYLVPSGCTAASGRLYRPQLGDPWWQPWAVEPAQHRTPTRHRSVGDWLLGGPGPVVPLYYYSRYNRCPKRLYRYGLRLVQCWCIGEEPPAKFLLWSGGWAVVGWLYRLYRLYRPQYRLNRCRVKMVVTVGKWGAYIKGWFFHLYLISYLSLSTIDAP